MAGRILRVGPFIILILHYNKPTQSIINMSYYLSKKLKNHVNVFMLYMPFSQSDAKFCIRLRIAGLDT